MVLYLGKKVNGFKLLNISAKKLYRDVQLGSKSASGRAFRTYLQKAVIRQADCIFAYF